LTSKNPRRTQAGTSGPAPKNEVRNYGPAPEKQRAVVTPSRIIREAPSVKAAPPAGLQAQRRRRDEEPESQVDGADAPEPVRARVRARPSDEMIARRRSRKERGVVDHGFDKRLGLDERALDTENYVYYWATQDMVGRLQEREYEVVDSQTVKGQETARHSGVDRNDKPQQSILMRKWKDWDEEDRRERLKVNREQDEALLRGKSKVLVEGGKGGADYTPEDGTGRPLNSVSIEERTH
jgi:hypothetical protein